MILAIIQARISSTRFPGKVMKKVLGKPLLWYLIQRLKLSAKINKILIATTNNKADDVIAQFAEKEQIDFFRGDENDVLGRYYNASIRNNPEIILRITADCPLVDPRLCDALVNKFIKENADYACLGQTFAEGADSEVFTFKALKESQQKARTQVEREHVTLYIHNHPKKFKRVILENNKDDSQYRFTFDEYADFKVINKILAYFIKINKQNFSYHQLITFLQKNPKISQINQNIVRNEGYIKSLSANLDITKQKYILFRVDGSKRIGLGHVMRCIGLAEEFKEIKYKPVFVIKNNDEQVIRKIQAFGFKIETLPNNINQIKEAELITKLVKRYILKTIVIDLSNKFVIKKLEVFAKYIKILKKEIPNITLIDGFNRECVISRVALPVNIAIVPYVGAGNMRYLKQNKTLYLLGPQYAVIRKEFLRIKSKRKISKKAHNILVLPGGSSNKIFIDKVAAAIKLLKEKDLHIKILRHSQSVAKLYKWADLAISASGLTMYELAFMGTPAIIIPHNRMHETIAKGFLTAGTIINLESKQNVSSKTIAETINMLADDPAIRRKLSISGKKLLDGKGAKRIIASIVTKEKL